MIAPLRRRHRLVIPALMLTLMVAAALALTHRAPSVRVDRLPPALLPSQSSSER